MILPSGGSVFAQETLNLHANLIPYSAKLLFTINLGSANSSRVGSFYVPLQ